MKRTLIAATLLAALLGTAAPAAAQHGSHQPIAIDDPWARATAPMAETGAAYLTIRNGGADGDRLISAASPVSKAVEMHTHIKDGNIMRMRKVDAIDVGPRSTVKLAPGGLHVMFIGLNRALKPGEKIPVTLTFEKAGKVALEVPVRSISPGHSGGGGAMGGHGH